MKNLFLLNRSGMGPDVMSRKGRYSLDPILSRLCLASLICLCMLTIGVGQMWGATTYKLTLVTSASGLNTTDKYVFEQDGYVMNNSISSNALVSTNSYSTTGLSGSESYIWKLASATTGYKMQCLGKTGNNYLANSGSTNVSFATSASGSDWSITFTDGIAKITNNSNNGRFLGWTNNSTSHNYKAYASNNSCSTYPCSITVYKLEEEVSCTSSITITKGSNPANGTFTLTSSGEVCIDEGNASTTVNATPNTHYHLATVTSTGGGSVGAISNNSCTVSNISANTTINVTFAADPTYTVTWAAGSNPSFNTQTDYAETALTSPGTPSAALYCPGGKEFVGWTATPIVGEDDEAPGDLFTSVAGKSIPVGGTTYYAVFATNGGGSDPDTDTEHGKTTTPYVANEGWTASAGGTYTSSGNYSVSPSIKFSSNNNYVQSPTYADAITNVTFWHKNQAGAGYLKIYVSTDGSSFTELTGERITLTANQYTVGTKDIDLDYEDGYKAVKIVFDRTSGNCCIDEIAVTYGGGASYSDYATTCASCNTNPTVGTASLKGSFSLTSVGVTATDWDPGTNCTWDEKGFVWGSSANPTVSNNKVTVNTGTSATWDGALVPSGSTDPTSLSVGNTYHYRAYGKNGKEGATYVYSSDASFTPRSVTCESVTGGTISAGTEVSVSGKTITLTATPDSHFSFGSWTVTNNSTSATITVTNNQFTMPDANVTVTATFNEDAYKTVTFYNNSTNTGITGYTNMKVYVGDTPSEPTLTDGTSGDACDATSDKHYGWSRDTWSGTIDTEAHMTGSPGNHTVYQKGSVPAVVAGDPATISYHAVWAAGSQYWGRLTSSTLSGLATGDRIVIVSTVDGRSGALQSITKTNDNEGVAIAAVPTETNNQISNPSSDIIWTLNANSTNWEIKSGDDKLGSKYTNCPNSVGTGILVQKGTNWTTWTFGSSSSGTDMIYIKNQGTTDCQLGLGIVTASSVNTWRAIKQTTVSSSSDCALKVYKEFGSYSTFLTTCCTTPTLAFAASPYATIRQDIHGASSSTWAEVDVTFTTNSSGTISVPDYGSGKSVYKLSSWEGRGTTGGTLCTTDHAYFELGETPGTGTLHVKTTTGYTGQGTYRIAITQAATDAEHGNYCEATVYGFVDVTLRDKFVDNVNDNEGPVNKDGHGAQVATPTLSEFGTQVENACHSEGRKLKGWIKETDLQTLYESGTPASTRVQTIDGLCESCSAGSDETSLIKAPGTNITTSGATWYAVWAYER